MWVEMAWDKEPDLGLTEDDMFLREKRQKPNSVTCRIRKKENFHKQVEQFGGKKELGGELGWSWQSLLQRAGGFLNDTRIFRGDKTKNLNVNDTWTTFFRLLYSTLLHLSNCCGDHRSLTLMAEYPTSCLYWKPCLISHSVRAYMCMLSEGSLEKFLWTSVALFDHRSMNCKGHLEVV